MNPVNVHVGITH